MAKLGPSIEFMKSIGKRVKVKPETLAERYAPARKNYPGVKSIKPGASIRTKGPSSHSVKK